MLTLLNIAAVLTLQAPPAPPPPPPHTRTETRVMVVDDGPGGLDADGDGQVTREEFAGPMNDAFARMDTDGNGRLSQDELSAGHGPGGPGGEHGMLLRGGPGGAPGERREERIVTINGGAPGDNGGEHNVFVHRNGPRVGPMRGRDGEGGTRIEIERRGGNDLDTDGDGKVSEAEFLAPMREAFARMDADHSGFVEQGERGGHGDVRVFTHRIETRDED